MSKDIAANPSTVSFSPKGVNVDALDDIAEQRGVSRAELIRSELKDLIDQHVASDGGSTDLAMPEHDELRDAYERLLALSDHPLGTRRVPVDEAKDKLNHSECPKEAVTRRLLAPLADLGFISVRTGRITVYRRTEGQLDAAEADADAQLERLGGFVDADLPQREEEHKQLIKYQRADLNAPLDIVGWVAGRTLWSDDGGVADV